jgi:hypothetical protein
VTNSSNSPPVASMTLTDSPNNATNTANDPATPHSQILLQNYFVPSSDGYDGRSADQQLLKLFLPVKLFGVQNSFRIYQPIATSPLFPDGRNAGFGDTTVYDLALHEVSRFTVGAGHFWCCRSRATKILALGNGKPVWLGSYRRKVVLDSLLRFSPISVPSPGMDRTAQR